MERLPGLSWTRPIFCTSWVRQIANQGVEAAPRQSPAVAAAINLYRGEVTNRAVAETFNLPYDARFESGEAKT